MRLSSWYVVPQEGSRTSSAQKRPKMPKTSATFTRPAALIVESDASFREALREASQGQDVFEVLRRALASRGYDVVITFCPEEAQRLMQERSFDRIYSDGTLPLTQAHSGAQAPAGPRVEDRDDGTARVQFDQVVPWSVAMQLLDILANNPPNEPRRLS